MPRTSFVLHETDDIVDAVGPVWPEQSVENELDQDVGVISEVRIWAAAGANRGEAPVVAALLQGPERELVRQVRIGIKASHLLQPYVLEFAPYVPQSGKGLTLQLWVSPDRSNHALFGTTERRFDRSGPTLNQNPTDHGPLAYDYIWRGDGWRAALAGSMTDMLRLASGIAAAALAVLLQPRVLQALRKVSWRTSAARRTVAVAALDAVYQARDNLRNRRHNTSEQGTSRAIYLFPWLIPAFAILHFLANNLLLVRAYEAIMISAIVMIATTVLFLIMRIVLRGTESAAYFVGLCSAAFFLYGHIYNGNNQPDNRFFIGIGVPLILGLAILLHGRNVLTPGITRFLNWTSIVLLIVPTAQIFLLLAEANSPDERDRSVLSGFPGIHDRIDDARSGTEPSALRDIYYIILDEYPRHGSPESFDNSDFVRELETRGFYVDPYARSNYPRTQYSISASLNMDYYEEYSWGQEKSLQLYRTANDHALGRIMRAIGYKYVHVSSGWYITNSSPTADLIVAFSSNGYTVSESQIPDPCFVERILTVGNEFTSEFLATTMVNRFFSVNSLDFVGACGDHWKDPSFALEWIEFMKTSARISGPKFVLAHFLKPHEPYSFDRHGNISPLREGWSDDHDPTVDSAFYGQILWLNDRLLEVIDAILSEYDEPPIIVIAGDHGGRGAGFGDPTATEVLAAYLLPDGGETVIYPHITSVNVFRSILNYYFDLDLNLLQDKVFSVYQ